MRACARNPTREGRAQCSRQERVVGRMCAAQHDGQPYDYRRYAASFRDNGVSYSVETASNEGRPPIERADDTAFDKPLRIEYLYEGRDAEFVSLREQIYYGDELTSKPTE